MSCSIVGKVCPECPFSRAVKPGALGGSPPEKYIAQSIGPFVLPCHLHCDFTNPDWKAKVIDTPQCLGAATFRANLGVDCVMPPALIRAKPDHETVFSNHAEFVAHHLQTGIAFARYFVQSLNLPQAVIAEMTSPEVKLLEASAINCKL